MNSNFSPLPRGVKNKSGGYVALLSVLIISGLTLVIAIGLAFRSIDDSKITTARAFGAITQNLAEACAEDALKKVKDSGSYQGNETLTFSLGTCQIYQVTKVGTIYTIKTQNTVSGFTQKIVVIVDRNNMNVLSWQAVADFAG
ncbi:MAG: hypothetical protein HY006_03765 [Candidatus Sungbacteria bacterium]|nr:hypothetical protein [Candidatus Sungbacteria bacterium]